MPFLLEYKYMFPRIWPSIGESPFLIFIFNLFIIIGILKGHKLWAVVFINVVFPAGQKKKKTKRKYIFNEYNYNCICIFQGKEKLFSIE